MLKLMRKNNTIENVAFFVGDMKNVFNQEFIETHGIPDIIITDPPRDACMQMLLNKFFRYLPKRLFM